MAILTIKISSIGAIDIKALINDTESHFYALKLVDGLN